MADNLTVQQRMLTANADYLAEFQGHYPDRPVQPALQLAVVACMDSRLALFGALGLQIGDAHLIRNAGALVTPDVLRSLAISQRRLGTREIVIIGHTNCGMSGFDDEQFRAELTESSGQAPDWDVPGFDDVARSVAGSVARVRSCGWLPHRDSVQGYVFDVRTAQITPVD
jgi:carbonic anhydrase